eukprot:CAMPEP_0171857202 /NCGR_PEP_ID=MMETSP0992-20121227/24547_1 /TAXON_ID=483369 /ORGANISM="non described non described, Strain CCMP2098" /LENGTH=52 /DNA_ID=CAMNT_0012478389 /DNA_START=8 /DNA_END=162 /DNA_ORIENTATION=-
MIAHTLASYLSGYLFFATRAHQESRTSNTSAMSTTKKSSAAVDSCANCDAPG